MTKSKAVNQKDVNDYQYVELREDGTVWLVDTATFTETNITRHLSDVILIELKQGATQ
ncbi:MAG TPA: hypothetical protein VFB28_03860 [Terriglobales bacterium]|nr:hypothetical protein [Terriglobales bacterium]